MDNKTTLQSHNDRLSALVEQVENLPDAGGGGGIVPSGTKQITENGTYDVTNYASAEVNVPQPEMPQTVEQATPSISVSSSGKITATATQTAGYVESGTKSATKQLTTKGATTVTPGSTEQTVVEAGTYVTGDIKVSAVLSGGGSGGDTGELQWCIVSNFYYISTEFPPTQIIYFKTGWTWADFIASQYNKWVPCGIEEEPTRYSPNSYDTEPSNLVKNKNGAVYFTGVSAELYVDYDNFVETMVTDAMIPGHTYHWS